MAHPNDIPDRTEARARRNEMNSFLRYIFRQSLAHEDKHDDFAAYPSPKSFWLYGIAIRDILSFHNVKWVVFYALVVVIVDMNRELDFAFGILRWSEIKNYETRKRAYH